jgi:mono/diheme cytochrome c family protein
MPFIADQKLGDQAIQRYRNGENVNPFCAQCHGPGGALDPNNEWNRRAEQRRLWGPSGMPSMSNRLSDTDINTIRSWINSQ